MDEFRELAEGRLSPERERALRARCAADPELQAELEASLEAHRLTGAADVKPPRCRVHFEEIEQALRDRRRRALRIALAAAAAVLILAVGATALGFFSTDASRGTPSRTTAERLILHAIPLDEVVVDEPGADIPAFLADYQPLDGSRIRWLTDFDNAKAAAGIAGRPVLVFLYYAKCPLCQSMQDGTLVDPEVMARLGGFVPVMVEVTKAPRGLDIRRLAREGFPWFGLLDERGEIVIAFPGASKVPEFIGNLERAREMVDEPPLSWGRLNALVARLLAAKQTEADDWLCDADAEYRALSSECPEGPLRSEAIRGRKRLEQRARKTLLGARALAEQGRLEAADQVLSDELEAFEDTLFAADFRAARAYLKAHGKFPELAAPSP